MHTNFLINIAGVFQGMKCMCVRVWRGGFNIFMLTCGARCIQTCLHGCGSLVGCGSWRPPIYHSPAL